MRVSELTLVGLLFTTNVAAQATGNPNTLRVNVDVFGNLVVASAAQTAPLTSTTLQNARLRVDANGNLVVALSGPSLFPDGTVGAPSISFVNSPTTGFWRAAADDIRWSSAGVAQFRILANNIVFRDAESISWSSTSDPASAADTTLARAAAGKIVLSGTTPMLLLGGTTSSFPALKQSGAEILFRTADDSAYAGIQGSRVLIQANGSLAFNNGIIFTVAPTISSGFGTSPTIPSNNGTALFTVNVGTGGTASAGVIGLPTANAGWACTVNMEAVVPTILTKQSASTTSTVTLTNYTVATGATAAWAASTILTVKCMAR